MPVGLQVAVLLFFGVGLLVYVRQAWKAVEVRMGAKGLEEYTPSRDDNPMWFYPVILIYTGPGGFCLGYTIMLMTGNAEPIPLS